jgi:hypothetical protein
MFSGDGIFRVTVRSSLVVFLTSALYDYIMVVFLIVNAFDRLRYRIAFCGFEHDLVNVLHLQDGVGKV